MFSDSFQLFLRGSVFLFAIALFFWLVTKPNHKELRLVLVPVEIYFLHLIAFYGFIIVFSISETIVDHWSTVLRVHSTATVVFLLWHLFRCSES